MRHENKQSGFLTQRLREHMGLCGTSHVGTGAVFMLVTSEGEDGQ